MPELPEVEVTRRGLLPHLPTKKITAVSWSNKRLRKPIPRKLLAQWIRGGEIATVDRRAKYLLVRLASGAILLIHLGMSGRLGLFTAETPPAKHDHLRLVLDNTMELRFNDTRRFGMVLVWPPENADKLYKEFFAKTGPEPFADDFTTDYLLGRAKHRKQPIKNFLLDQKIVAGIGNIYANEILFATGRNPLTPVNTIDKKTWQDIIDCCRDILTTAIKMGGSTIADFLGSSGKPGYFQLQLTVYDRMGEPCTLCRTPIEKTIIGGRATYFCPQCQKGRLTKN